MSEKLIPFDFEEFKKDPSRLRVYSSTPTWAEPIRDCVALISANGGAYLYKPDEFNALRLAAKTRKVRVRFFRDPDDLSSRPACNIAQADFVDRDRHPSGFQWTSDIIEVEVTE